jgi:protein-disulfide isomerase
MRKKNNFWKIASAILGILLVISIFTGGFRPAPTIDRVINELNELQARHTSPDVNAAITSAIQSLQEARRSMQPARGNGDGLLIEVFSDFECPFCARAVPVIDRINNEYGEQVNVVFRHFPLVSIHPNALKASEASECARDQDMFWEYHDVLFENQRALDVPNLKRYAAELGLNAATFNACLDSGAKEEIVDRDFREGINRGVQGTPTFFIDDEMLVGAQPFENFRPIIERKLAEEPGQAPAAQPTQPAGQTLRLNMENARIKGDPDAPITIVEWSDFFCGFCGRFAKETLPSIMQEYIDAGEVKFVYKDFPVVGGGAAAEASWCAHEQGKFWEFHDKVFDDQTAARSANFLNWAAELGLDADQFSDCINTGKYRSNVQRDAAEGQSAGITGTPGFIIGLLADDGTLTGQKVSGAQPFANFKSVIDAQLARV